MKLLFDAILSPQLVRLLDDAYPGSRHVFDCGDIAEDDRHIWAYARSGGFTIVSKDGDFRHMSFTLGGPPKVIWLRVGNARTTPIADLIRDHAAEISVFEADAVTALLILSF